MNRLSAEEVRHIARLASLDLTEGEVERLRDELSELLAHFQVLQEVDTCSMLPMAQVGVEWDVTRPDTTLPSLRQEDVLASASQEEDGFIKIKAVLD